MPLHYQAMNWMMYLMDDSFYYEWFFLIIEQCTKEVVTHFCFLRLVFIENHDDDRQKIYERISF
jgi:hypothetical protein